MIETMPLVVQPSAGLMPALAVEQMRERRDLMQALVRDALVVDVDFGIIPGTQKPTLFKSGAEKLCTFFGLSVRLRCVEAIEDWTGEHHGGEPLFSYRYATDIYRGDLLVASAEGSCSSWESRYRWRDSKRTCPSCGQAAIINGKAEYGGGYICFKKQGGCGTKFAKGDKAIEDQTLGRVANPDIYDLVNTCQKMGQKRSMVGATLIAVNASDFFTQDMEDAPQAPVRTWADLHAREIEEAVGKLVAATTLAALNEAAEWLALQDEGLRHAPAVRKTYAAMRAQLTPKAEPAGEVIEGEVTEHPSPKAAEPSPDTLPPPEPTPYAAPPAAGAPVPAPKASAPVRTSTGSKTAEGERTIVGRIAIADAATLAQIRADLAIPERYPRPIRMSPAIAAALKAADTRLAAGGSAGPGAEIQAALARIDECTTQDQLDELAASLSLLPDVLGSGEVQAALAKAANTLESGLAVGAILAAEKAAGKFPSHIADADFPASALANGEPT